MHTCMRNNMAFILNLSPKAWIFTIFFIGCFSSTLGHKILMSSFYGMGSHFLAGARVAESLRTKGHNVTFLISEAYGHRAEDPLYSNFSFQIFKHTVPKEEILDAFEDFARNAFESFEMQFLKSLNKILMHNINDCVGVLRDEVLMENIEEIDAIVVDPAWICGYFIRDLLEMKTNNTRKVPLVVLTPMPNQYGFMIEEMGSPFNRAYQPELSSGYTNNMSFLQRTANVFLYIYIQVIGKFIVNQWHCVLAEETGQSCRNFDVLATYGKADIMLMNSNFAVDFPHALAPNIIPIGGLTCRPAASLTQELEDFVQSSGDHGVIVFTLGTYLASVTTIRPDIVAMFAEAFQRLPQKVIWQLKELPDWELPSNVKTMPWIPQNDLLGHPKTRVLIYQGGNNGFQEACYHGVPIVVIPLHVDQPDVAARIEARGMGVKLEKLSLTADIIYEALTNVINDKRFHTVAKEVSAIYRDRNQAMTGPDLAAFWIEHVIKFGGDYLRSPANKFSFFQYHLLDVYAFLLTIVITFLMVVFYVSRFCLFMFMDMKRRDNRTKSKSE